MVSNGDVEINVCLSLDDWEVIHEALEFYDSDTKTTLAAFIRKAIRNGLPYTEHWYDKR